jgi:tetratricopeptide (TPR) repeat protein
MDDTLAKHRMANARCFVALVVKGDDISIDTAESRNASLLSALLVHSTAWLRLVVPGLVGEYHDRCSSGGDATGCADAEEKTCIDFVGVGGRGGAFGMPPSEEKGAPVVATTAFDTAKLFLPPQQSAAGTTAPGDWAELGPGDLERVVVGVSPRGVVRDALEHRRGARGYMGSDVTISDATLGEAAASLLAAVDALNTVGEEFDDIRRVVAACTALVAHSGEELGAEAVLCGLSLDSFQEALLAEAATFAMATVWSCRVPNRDPCYTVDVLNSQPGDKGGGGKGGAKCDDETVIGRLRRGLRPSGHAAGRDSGSGVVGACGDNGGSGGNGSNVGSKGNKGIKGGGKGGKGGGSLSGLRCVVVTGAAGEGDEGADGVADGAGVGKTSAVVEYLYQDRAWFHTGIFWVDAASDLTLAASFILLASDLGLNFLTMAGTHRPREVVFRALAERHGWIIVYDNADDLSTLAREWFPPAAAEGSVVLTSRVATKELRRACGDSKNRLVERAVVVEVAPLGLEASKVLLWRQRASKVKESVDGSRPPGAFAVQTGSDTAAVLAAAVEASEGAEMDAISWLASVEGVGGRTPLLLTMAGACVGASNMSFSEYAALYRGEIEGAKSSAATGAACRAAEGSAAEPAMSRVELALQGAWRVVARCIEGAGAGDDDDHGGHGEDEPRGSALGGVHLFSVFAANHIPTIITMLQMDVTGASAGTSGDASVLTGAGGVENRIGGDNGNGGGNLSSYLDLVNYSAISTCGEGLIGMHRVVQCTVTRWVQDGCGGVAGTAIPSVRQTMRWGMQICIRGLTTDCLPELGTSIKRWACWQKHGEALLRRMAASKCDAGDDALLMIKGRLMSLLAYGINDIGFVSRAEAMYGDALDIMHAQPDARFTDIALTVNNMAGLYTSQGNYEKAQAMYTRALTSMRRDMPNDHKGLATTMMNLSMVHELNGSSNEARCVMEEMLALRRAALDADDPDLAPNIDALASLLNKQGQIEDSLVLYEDALALRRRVLPRTHPDVARTCVHVAYLQFALGHTDLAEAMYEEALEIRRVALPHGHPDLAAVLYHCASMYKVHRRYDEAAVALGEAFDMMTAPGASHHPHLVTVVEMAVSIHRSGEERRYEEAEAMCDEALSSMRQSLPSDHADVATVLSVLAEVHQSQRAYSKAEKLIRLALQMRMRVLPPQHPDIATSLSSLALLHQAEGWHEKAQVLYTKALAIRRTALPRDHPDIATNLNNLAALHQSQNRLDEAEMMYVEGLGIMRRTLSMEHPDIAASINNLAGLHMAQGRYEKVEGMYIEALALRRKVLPADHPDIAESINNLAYLYFEKRLLDKAEPLLLEALTIGRKRLAAGHPNLVKYQRGLDMCRRVAQTGHASKPKLITLKKVGVNDPCPCGSKKKYVKLLTLCILCHILHSLLGVFWTYFWDIATMIHLKHGPLPSFLTILSSPLRYKKCCR